LLENARPHVAGAGRLGERLDQTRPLLDHATEHTARGHRNIGAMFIGLDPEVGDLDMAGDFLAGLNVGHGLE
jgi:hypothetical protein